MRTTDIHDIADIINNFFNIFDEIIWSNHNDLFGDETSPTLISARVLGREIGKILKRNENLRDRIIGIIQKNTDKSDTKMAGIIASFLNQPLEEVLALLEAIVKGIHD